MQRFTRWLENIVGLEIEFQTKLLSSILIICAIALIRYIILKTVTGRTENLFSIYQWKKSLGYISFFLGILLVGSVWFEGFQSLSTFLGLLTAGLAIALKDLVTNLAGWTFIIWRRPFRVGDRIQIGEHFGDVIDIRIFQFSLMEIGNWVDADQSTGRIVHVPNGKVFLDSQANYTAGFKYIWNEIPVLVTFESNWKKAKNILYKIAGDFSEHLSETAKKQLIETSKKYMIIVPDMAPYVYTSVHDSGVLLTLRYIVDPYKRRISTETVWEEILEQFSRSQDIDFAYPTKRIFYNIKEGKPGTKPEGSQDVEDNGKLL